MKDGYNLNKIVSNFPHHTLLKINWSELIPERAPLQIKYRIWSSLFSKETEKTIAANVINSAPINKMIFLSLYIVDFCRINIGNNTDG